jgi:hypothetical protein
LDLIGLVEPTIRTILERLRIVLGIMMDSINASTNIIAARNYMPVNHDTVLDHLAPQ